MGFISRIRNIRKILKKASELENRKKEVIGINTTFLTKGEIHTIQCPYCKSDIHIGGFPCQEIKLTDR